MTPVPTPAGPGVSAKDAAAAERLAKDVEKALSHIFAGGSNSRVDWEDVWNCERDLEKALAAYRAAVAAEARPAGKGLTDEERAECLRIARYVAANNHGLGYISLGTYDAQWLAALLRRLANEEGGG